MSAASTLADTHGSRSRVKDGPRVLAAPIWTIWCSFPRAAALTRRTRKHSRLSAVVLIWGRARERHERQGLLVENEALDEQEVAGLLLLSNRRELIVSQK